MQTGLPDPYDDLRDQVALLTAEVSLLRERLADRREALVAVADGIAALRDAARAYADAEHDYRLAHAKAYLSSSGTVGEREAQVYEQIGELRRDRDYADAIRTAAVEAVRSRRTQLSAVQSLLAAHKEEAALARTTAGP